MNRFWQQGMLTSDASDEPAGPEKADLKAKPFRIVEPWKRAQNHHLTAKETFQPKRTSLMLTRNPKEISITVWLRHAKYWSC